LLRAARSHAFSSTEADPMRYRTLSLTLILALMAGSLAFAAPQSDVGVVFELQSDGRTMEMKVLSSDSMGTRFDMMGSERGDASMVWREDGMMLMIMHAQQMYMEFSKEAMERMSQMMQKMGRAPKQPSEEVDISQYSFEETGNTDTINGMDAFEVRVSGPEGDQAMLWLTEDAEVGLFEAMARMMEPLQNMAMPGMNNPMEGFSEYEALARAQGLPDGRVIRVVDAESGTQMTLQEVIPGPFDASMFEAPAGYQKQQMPMMR
jgi:hypothetical protein